jgi:hypothetical protein
VGDRADLGTNRCPLTIGIADPVDALIDLAERSAPSSLDISPSRDPEDCYALDGCGIRPSWVSSETWS